MRTFGGRQLSECRSSHAESIPGAWVESMLEVSPETSFASIRRGHRVIRNQRQVEVVIERLRLAGIIEQEAL